MYMCMWAGYCVSLTLIIKQLYTYNHCNEINIYFHFYILLTSIYRSCLFTNKSLSPVVYHMPLHAFVPSRSLFANYGIHFFEEIRKWTTLNKMVTTFLLHKPWIKCFWEQFKYNHSVYRIKSILVFLSSFLPCVISLR